MYIEELTKRKNQIDKKNKYKNPMTSLDEQSSESSKIGQ